MGVVGDPVEHLSDLTKVLILEKYLLFGMMENYR